MDNLQKVQISIGRNFFWRYTYTDDEGFFSAPKKYRGKVRIRAKWRGNRATIRKTWNEVLGLWVSDHLMTIKRHGNERTKNIMFNEPHDGVADIDLAGGHLWYKGTVHNGLRKYIDYCLANGISNTISDANVWCWAKGKNSSTPMLYKYRQLPQLASVAGIGEANFWNALTQNLVGNAVSLVPKHLRPDQILANLKDQTTPGDTQSNTVIIHQLVFHESGHYSHASKAGASFWADVFASEVSNQINYHDSYDDGSKPSYQSGKRIALAEGWATFAEFKIVLATYNKGYINAENFNEGLAPTATATEAMEGFTVYNTPMSQNRRDNRGWFLHGIMWDLMDDHDDEESVWSLWRDGNGDLLGTITDNAYIGNLSNANDLSAIFNRLGSNVNSASDLKTACLSAFQNESADINTLFTTYGY